MKITFAPTGQSFEVTPEKSVMQVAHENKIAIRSVCKGVPSCAECRVKIVEGENNVLPPNKAEINLIGTNYFIDHRRLSCQLHCFGDVTVDISDHLNRSETQNKKVRGGKRGHTGPSYAVNDTLLLKETDKPGK